MLVGARPIFAARQSKMKIRINIISIKFNSSLPYSRYQNCIHSSPRKLHFNWFAFSTQIAFIHVCTSTFTFICIRITLIYIYIFIHLVLIINESPSNKAYVGCCSGECGIRNRTLFMFTQYRSRTSNLIIFSLWSYMRIGFRLLVRLLYYCYLFFASTRNN